MCEHGLDYNFLRQFQIRQLGQLYMMLLLGHLQALKLLSYYLHHKAILWQNLFINLQQILIPDKHKHHIKLWICLLGLYLFIQLLHASELLHSIILPFQVFCYPRSHMPQLIIQQKTKLINTRIDIRICLLLSQHLLLCC